MKGKPHPKEECLECGGEFGIGTLRDGFCPECRGDVYLPTPDQIEERMAELRELKRPHIEEEERRRNEAKIPVVSTEFFKLTPSHTEY